MLRKKYIILFFGLVLILLPLYYDQTFLSTIMPFEATSDSEETAFYTVMLSIIIGSSLATYSLLADMKHSYQRILFMFLLWLGISVIGVYSYIIVTFSL
jgi:hypothetical protein